MPITQTNYLQPSTGIDAVGDPAPQIAPPADSERVQRAEAMLVKGAAVAPVPAPNGSANAPAPLNGCTRRAADRQPAAGSRLGGSSRCAAAHFTPTADRRRELVSAFYEIAALVSPDLGRGRMWTALATPSGAVPFFSIGRLTATDRRSPGRRDLPVKRVTAIRAVSAPRRPAYPHWRASRFFRLTEV